VTWHDQLSYLVDRLRADTYMSPAPPGRSTSPEKSRAECRVVTREKPVSLEVCIATLKCETPRRAIERSHTSLSQVSHPSRWVVITALKSVDDSKRSRRIITCGTFRDIVYRCIPSCV
jgi:hypothetical protein